MAMTQGTLGAGIPGSQKATKPKKIIAKIEAMPKLPSLPKIEGQGSGLLRGKK